MIAEWLAPVAGLAGDGHRGPGGGGVWASEKVSGANWAGHIGQAEPGYRPCMQLPINLSWGPHEVLEVLCPPQGLAPDRHQTDAGVLSRF